MSIKTMSQHEFQYFGKFVQYSYTDTLYLLSIELDNGDVYGMNEIYEKYESLMQE